MPSTAIVKFSEADENLLMELFRDRKSDLSLIAKMEPREVLADVARCVSVLVKLDRVSAPVGALLGCLMARVAKEKLYEVAGFDSLAEYEDKEIEGKGASHATVWRYKRLSETFPDLPLERYAAIGTNKLLKAAQVCNDKTSPKQKKELLAKAEECKSVEEYTDYLEKKSGLSAPGETTGAVVQLTGSAADAKDFQEWITDPQAIEFAGTEQPLKMCLAAFSEASSVFPHQEDAPKKGKKEDW